MRAQLKPYHHIQAEQNITVIDQLYGLFNQEATSHEADELRTLDVMKKLKSGDLSLDQIEITDNAWDIMPADMIPEGTTVTVNGRKPKKAAADAVPAASS